MDENLYQLATGALTAMAHKRMDLEAAAGKNVNYAGASAVLFVQKDALEDLRAGKDRLILEPVFGVTQISRASSSDPKVFYNFPVTVAGKLWQMVRTGKASGSKGAIAGEPTYLGGIIVEWGSFYVFIAYSGAPEEKDFEISKAGAESLPDWEEFQRQFD